MASRDQSESSNLNRNLPVETLEVYPSHISERNAGKALSLPMQAIRDQDCTKDFVPFKDLDPTTECASCSIMSMTGEKNTRELSVLLKLSQNLTNRLRA